MGWASLYGGERVWARGLEDIFFFKLALLRTTKIEQPEKAARACKIGLEMLQCNSDPARKINLYKKAEQRKHINYPPAR